MPLTPTYTWSETADKVLIDIPGITLKDPSQLFTSDCCLKLNAAPYLLVLDLHDYIDVKHSKALLKRSAIHVELVKQTPGLWGKLQAEGTAKELQPRRQASIQRKYDSDVAQAQQRLEKKSKADKDASDRRIEQDHLKRQQLEAAKADELQKERDQLQQWKEGLHKDQGPTPDAAARQNHLQRDQGDESDYEASEEEAEQHQQAEEPGVAPDHPDYHGRGWRTSGGSSSRQNGGDEPCQLSAKGSQQEGRQLVDSTHIWDSHSSDATAKEEPVSLTASAAAEGAAGSSTMQQLLSVGKGGADGSSTTDVVSDSAAAGTSSGELLTAVTSRRSQPSTVSSTESRSQPAQQQPQQPVRPAAAVRAAIACVPVEFTQLETPHLPAREAREEELKAYKQQAAAGQLLEDSESLADRQPVFLKDKADALYAQQNYSGALSAYSRALQLDPSHLQLYSDRAACHLQLGNHWDCIQDCTTALDLLRQRHSWARPQEHQGEEGGQHQQGDEGSIGCRGIVEGSVSAAVGGAAPVCGQQVLATVPEECEAGSGQDQGGSSSSSLAGDSSAGAEDCGAVVAAAGADTAQEEELLEGAAGQSAAAAEAGAAGPDNPMADMVAAAQGKGNRPLLPPAPKKVPVDPAVAARSLLLKLLSRRAAAYAELQRFELAAADLQEALRFDRGNQQLQQDLQELQDAAVPLDAAGLKARGAARFKGGDVEGALQAFQLLLQLPPDQVTASDQISAHSNISACRLALRQYAACIQDCAAAMQQLLRVMAPAAGQQASAAAGSATQGSAGRSSSQSAASNPAGNVAADAAAGGNTDKQAVLLFVELLVQRAVQQAEPQSSTAAGGSAGQQAGRNQALVAGSQQESEAAAKEADSAGSAGCAADEAAAQAAAQAATADGVAPELRSQLQSIAKLLGRMAVSCGYLKRPVGADAAYAAAQRVAQLGGLQQLADKMLQDRQQLAAHQDTQPGSRG